MKRQSQPEPFAVQQIETNQWSLPIDTCNHFKLVLIRTGSGHHRINGNQLPYQAGDIFFLGPLDAHHFVIDKKTRFALLSFSEFYLAELTPDCQQIRAHSMRNYKSLKGSIITDRAEQKNLTALVEILLTEQTSHAQLASNPVIESLMRTILSVLDRQLRQLQPRVSPSVSGTLMQRIGAYISQHITDSASLRLENLADVFNYSQSHLRALFKQQTGESIQQFIIRYKLQLVETRLHMSSMSISQIADELGFTDVCHLNKLFKRYYQRTPTDYRREKSSLLSTNARSLPLAKSQPSVWYV